MCDGIRNFVHAPENWSPPGKPDTYNHVAKSERGEPQFSDLDNPGRWDNFSYQPKFDSREKGYKYLGHYLPTGVTVVPKNSAGKRFVDGYEFFYNGWKGDTERRNGATNDNLFPSERRGMLDPEKLKLHGLSKERMCNDLGLPDAAFFYQLLLPFCDPEKSGLPGDKRKAFYTKVQQYSNSYAVDCGACSAYGHDFKLISIQELIHWDGIVYKDGVLGGSQGGGYTKGGWGVQCIVKKLEIQ